MIPFLKTPEGMAPTAREVDLEKFKARYGLTDQDFTYRFFNGELWIVLNEGIALTDNPPIFDPPDPPIPPKTPTELATDLADLLGPSVIPPPRRAEFIDKLLRLTAKV